ncbi:hypothetical protein PF004_g16178 [Phytophthora fragariae]|uniref:Uncharacterized protein n=1 Tax=Phytophthora fragariae TaxID=53985 RepID=A0A6G0NJ66_9STRA|nr:hypothetical protein PF004_g16178 [Phytophthora fragariae]
MLQSREVEAVPASPVPAPAETSVVDSPSSLVAQTDDVTAPENQKDDQNPLTPTNEDVHALRASIPKPRLSGIRGLESSQPRPSIANVVAAEVATFYDVFGFLGVPMIIVFLLSAAWTFMLAAIQVNANTIANSIMNTTHFDNGQFWLLPQPKPGLAISATVLLSGFGVGYLALAITMLGFFRSGCLSDDNDAPNTGNVSNNNVVGKPTQSLSTPPASTRNAVQRIVLWVHELPIDVRQHYYIAALDLPKLIFQSITLYTYLLDGFPTAIIYYYSVLLVLNWLVACYRSQHYVSDPDLIIARLYYTFDLFFAVFAPLVVLVYFTMSFQFDRAEFMTRMETLTPSSFDNVARIFGLPAQISSFCSAFHYLQFSSGDTLFYKSGLNLLSVYKWRNIILTLIRNYRERELERKRKASVGPVSVDTSRTSSLKAVILKTLSASKLKPRVGRHFVPKLLLSLVFFAWGIFCLVFSIGSVRSTQALCGKYDKCVVPSYQWNFGRKHCTCLVFADRVTSPKTYAEWIDPEDTTSNLADLAVAGELRIVQIINRAVPALPDELRGCHSLQQLILVYTKTEYLPGWMSEFSHLEYIHVEGDFTSKRLTTVADGIFDNMPHLTFLHLGTIPNVEKLPSLSSLKNLRYLTLAVLDSLEGEGQEQRRPPSPSSERIRSPRPSYMMTKLSRASISDARLSVANIFATEVATFYDVFGVLGVPMLILFGVSAGWTFMLAAIQVHADTMANTIMKTTEFDNGEFWLLPKADTGIIIAAVVLLTLFGIGYTALAVTMVFFYHAGVPKEADLAQSRTVSPVAKNSRSSSIQIAIPRKGILVRFVQRGIDWFRGLSSDVCEHYFTAALDLPKLVFQSATLYTYLRQGFPTPIIYYYSVLLLCSWLVTSYRSQHYAVDPNLIITRLYYTFDLFFAVFAPLVVLIYYIYTFKFDRAEFLTRSYAT